MTVIEFPRKNPRSAGSNLEVYRRAHTWAQAFQFFERYPKRRYCIIPRRGLLAVAQIQPDTDWRALKMRTVKPDYAFFAALARDPGDSVAGTLFEASEKSRTLVRDEFVACHDDGRLELLGEARVRGSTQ